MDFTHDVAGRIVRQDDAVGGTTPGRYPATITGQVTEIGTNGKRVKLKVATTTRLLDGRVGTETWLDTDRIFLIAVGPADLPATGEWTDEDDEAVRDRVAETTPVRYPDRLTRTLMARIVCLDDLAEAYRADASKLTRLELPLERAWRKGYAPDMDDVADIFGWKPDQDA